MRRTLIYIAVTIIVLIGATGTWGVTLPREHRAASRITLTALGTRFGQQVTPAHVE